MSPAHKKTSGSSCFWKLSLSIALASIASLVGAVTLGWDASRDASVNAYALYWGPAPRTYTNAVNFGNSLTGRITGLKVGSTQYFAVTALNAQGLESAFSSEIQYVVPAPVLKTNVGVYVRVSTSLTGPWTNIFALVVTNPVGQLFFSTVITNQ